MSLTVQRVNDPDQNLLVDQQWDFQSHVVLYQPRPSTSILSHPTRRIDSKISCLGLWTSLLYSPSSVPFSRIGSLVRITLLY